MANVVGVPLGTAIGTAFGWRMTFWAVAAARPHLARGHRAARPGAIHRMKARSGSLLAEIKVLGREPVYTSLIIIMSQTVGQFALFTYISPLLTDVVGRAARCRAVAAARSSASARPSACCWAAVSPTGS